MKSINSALLFLILFSSLNGYSNDKEKDIESRPNIILIMADDLGWGDVGFNGNELVQTPSLDAMAANGIVFSRFYSAAPVCSPTRGSCLTGRHPFRYGIYTANAGRMKSKEITLAEYLKTKGFATGHFGKWHLGTLTNDEIDANRGGRNVNNYSPPWENGFDVCFSTESKVPTWNPMVTPENDAGDIGKRIPGSHFGTFYWTGAAQKVHDNLEGDDSRIIMDRVIPFIEKQAADDIPFFTVIWFHTPHLPVLTGEKYRNLYPDCNIDIQHYYGAISAMDEQIGRLNKTLTKLGLAENTLIFFTSDNGPEGAVKKGRTQGSAGGFKGRKRSLYEGGVRVPGFVNWPAKIQGKQKMDFPLVTSDYFPTILDIFNESENIPVSPIDGISMLPVWNNEMKERAVPIGFQHGKNKALNDNQFKLIEIDGNFELYNIIADPFEKKDISALFPEKLKEMQEKLKAFVESCEGSMLGNDY